MGKTFTDAYSLLHFAVGIIFYFWNISLTNAVLIHVAFEVLENTDSGMLFINKYFPFWPGGKPYADASINSIGDTFYFILGFLLASFIA